MVGAGDFTPSPIKPGEPCPDAKRLELTELVASASGPIWMPSHPVASARTLAGTWSCGGTPMLVFESGVTIEFDHGWEVPDPLQRWSEMAQQWGRGHVDEVLGRPAFVQPAGATDPVGKVYRGEVVVIVGTTLIRVFGNGEIAGGELVEMVNTIDVGQPLTAT